MASCLLCLFIASFWETLHSPRMQHKPKHLSVPLPESVTQGILLFLPYFPTHTFSHLSSRHLQSLSLQPGLDTDFFLGAWAWGWCVSHCVTLETQALGFKYDKFNLMCSWIIIVTFQSYWFHHLHVAVERMWIILYTMKSFWQLCWFTIKVCWPVCALYHSLLKCCQLYITVWEWASL